MYDGIDVDGGHVVARPKQTIAGIDRQWKVQGREGAEDQAKLGAGLAVLDGHDPLPSDPRLAGEFGLAQLEFSASVADGQTEIQRGSYFHDVSDVVERQQCNCVVERRQMEIVLDQRLSSMSAFGYISESGSETIMMTNLIDSRSGIVPPVRASAWVSKPHNQPQARANPPVTESPSSAYAPANSLQYAPRRIRHLGTALEGGSASCAAGRRW